MKKLKFILPFLFTLCVIFIFYFKRIVALKYYPVCCNLIFFTIFFVSLFTKETAIQKIAKVLEGGELTETISNYTKNLTYIWCIFAFFNLAISIWTVFLSDRIWMLYNGCISYVLMWSLFIGEYAVRTILRKKGRLS